MSVIAQRLKEFFGATPFAGVASAYLFGSHSQDRAHRESDVDVGVLLDRRTYPEGRDRFDLRVRLTAELIGALHHNEVDVVILNDAPPELGRRIVTGGIRVFCEDVETDHAFVRDVQLRAADLAPFLKRMRDIKLRSLARD